MSKREICLDEFILYGTVYLPCIFSVGANKEPKFSVWLALLSKKKNYRNRNFSSLRHRNVLICKIIPNLSIFFPILLTALFESGFNKET